MCGRGRAGTAAEHGFRVAGAAFGVEGVFLLQQHRAIRPDLDGAERVLAMGTRAAGYREGVPQEEDVIQAHSRSAASSMPSVRICGRISGAPPPAG